jgi:hypothetical protein
VRGHAIVIISFVMMTTTTTTTTCWQQLLNEGDYVGAYISQECPCFVPGDGSWADFYFRLLHYVEHPSHYLTEEEFLQRASQTTLQQQQQQQQDHSVERYQDEWKLYVKLSRLYATPVQVCVFFATFLQYSAKDLARAMAQRRGDVEGLHIVLQHISSLQSSTTTWIQELDISLSPRVLRRFMPLLCQDDKHVEQLVGLVRKQYKYTGQARNCLEWIDHALDYCYQSNHNTNQSTVALQKLREEYTKKMTSDENEPYYETTNSSIVSVASMPTHNHQNDLVNDKHDTLVNEYKACRLRLEHMDQKVSSMLHSIQSFCWTAAAAAAARDCDAENAVCWEFLQDLTTCIQNDESCEYMVAKLESHVLKLKEHQVTSCSPTVHETTTARHDVNQVSFTSADTIAKDENDDNESFTNNESHSCHSKQQQHDYDKLIQLEQTVQRLQNQLQQQAQDFALERMGDKARIEYFMTMLHQNHAETKIRLVSSSSENDDLQLALDISEQGRIRAVQELQQERELYAQKLQQLMRLAVQQEQNES